MCGAPEIDMELLRAHTRYQVRSTCTSQCQFSCLLHYFLFLLQGCTATDAHIGAFWQARSLTRSTYCFVVAYRLQNFLAAGAYRLYAVRARAVLALLLGPLSTAASFQVQSYHDCRFFAAILARSVAHVAHVLVRARFFHSAPHGFAV